MMLLQSEHWDADLKARVLRKRLDTLLCIPTVQSVLRHVVPAFAGVIARSGNYGREIEVPSEERMYEQT